MATFLRLLSEADKGGALSQACVRLRAGEIEEQGFEIAADAFDVVPGKPFAYWVSEAVRKIFIRLPHLQSARRSAYLGGSTKNDFRFLRLHWESSLPKWTAFAKGGAFSRFYADVYLVINWAEDARELEAELLRKYPYLGESAEFVLHRRNPYYRPGLTWPLRTQIGLGLRAMPAGCIFGHKGPAAFVADDNPSELLALLALANSSAFALLVSLQMAFGSYEVGVIKRTPVPDLSPDQQTQLAKLSRRAWSLKRNLDTVTETSHAFLLPAALRPRANSFAPAAIEVELAQVQAEIDDIAFHLYGFSDADRQAALGRTDAPDVATETEGDDEDEDAGFDFAVDQRAALLSWAVGVAFGRFDWRLATGERGTPPEPEPFDPQPAKSLGMLSDGAEPFHTHAGILVDDPGHRHDLVRLVERVLDRVDMPGPSDLRRWLQREFFPFHLQRYSKSRRKAPIYWPLATASGGYTLWLYYPALSRQTLYSAINDFVDPKLTDVASEANQLRTKGSALRSEEEKRLAALATLEHELRDLRDQLQAIASQYQPNHDDGVQITAAPLWPLFRHKPWQKVLKDTWAKLGRGEYDWSHLAMHYWPGRVRKQCETDKSMAIAHGLEGLYMKPAAKQKNSKGPKDSTI